MYASTDQLRCHRHICRVKLEELTELFRPTDFVCLHAPGKAARRTELLRSFEKCGASLERCVASHALNGIARDVDELRDVCGVTTEEVGVALALIDGKDSEGFPGKRYNRRNLMQPEAGRGGRGRLLALPLSIADWVQYHHRCL